MYHCINVVVIHQYLCGFNERTIKHVCSSFREYYLVLKQQQQQLLLPEQLLHPCSVANSTQSCGPAIKVSTNKVRTIYS